MKLKMSHENGLLRIKWFLVKNEDLHNVVQQFVTVSKNRKNKLIKNVEQLIIVI